jgi:hypothetical protein
MRESLRIGRPAAAAFPHLPPGREPGIQSLRNRPTFTFWSPVAGVVGSGMLLAGIFVAAGGRGSEFDRGEELLGGIIFALLGVLCIYGGWVMRQRARPNQAGRMRGTSLSVDPGEMRRGEEISITFRGKRENDDRLEVGLVCVERHDMQVRVSVKGVSTVSRQTVEAAVHEQWQPVPPAVREQTFTFEIPDSAPYSYEGECVSYSWRASARAVRRLRRDPRLDLPIWVQP